MKILLHPADIFAAISHEHHLLVFLHPLGLHQLPEPLARLFVVALHVPEALRRRYFLLILPPECDDAFTRDHLEPSLLVRRPNITAIDANRDRTNR
jgi:hypothetical protein